MPTARGGLPVDTNRKSAYPDYCHTRTNVGRNDGYSTVSVASDEVFTNPVFTSLPAKELSRNNLFFTTCSAILNG